MITNEEIRTIGKFQRTHALKGELNAIFDDDIDIEALTPELPLIVEIDGINIPFFAESIRPKGHFTSLLKLQGVDDVEEAKQFVNKEIHVRKSDYNELRYDVDDDDEGGYAEDFIGYDVVTEDGTMIGRIEDADVNTDNPLFILRGETGDMVYIPIVDEFFVEINEEEHRIVMDLPEGLIELNK